MGLFKNLFGKPKPAAKKPGSPPAKDSARAKLIADALRIQRTQGAVVRKTLSHAIGSLTKTGSEILRDPDALERLMSLIQTRQTLNGLADAAPGLLPPADWAKGPKAAQGTPVAPKSRAVRR